MKNNINSYHHIRQREVLFQKHISLRVMKKIYNLQLILINLAFISS